MGAHDAIRIRSIRRQMGWTRGDLARLLAIPVACVARIERGQQELTADAIKRLQSVLTAK